MIQLNRPLILASGSPRRKELLDTMKLSYTVEVSDADESYSADPESMVLELSRRKASAVAEKHPHSIILAADTLVYCEDVLGKPRNAEHAKAMLRKLSGNWHSVFTGITLIDTHTGKVLSKADMTRVHFVELSDKDIDDYLDDDEYKDKAGSYAIQGMGGMFIDRIEGSYSNVVGLPTALVRGMLLEIGAEN